MILVVIDFCIAITCEGDLIMRKKYYYKVYGQTVISEVEMDELIEIEAIEKADMTVRFGGVPEKALSELKNGKKIVSRGNEIAYEIAAVGYFYLKEGKEIHIEAHENYDRYLIKTFILGSAMGISMIMRGMIPLHSGTVTRDGKGIVVTGDCGAGKSTLITALRLSGMKMVADDVSVIGFSEEGDLYINPAFPQSKLCRNTALQFGYDLNELIYIDESRDKFAVRLKDDFCEEKVPFTILVHLMVGDEDQDEDIIVEEVTGHAKLMTVIDNIYRGFIYKGMGMPPEVMKKCLAIATKVPMYSIKRRPGIDAVPYMLKAVKKMLDE